MSPEELKVWLKEEESSSSGQSKDDGSETVGHESGRKIIEILESNPKRDPNNYGEDQLAHMYVLSEDELFTFAHTMSRRKVVSYCKRHLAQEAKAKEDTNSKSYKSLKNWGHDALKT